MKVPDESMKQSQSLLESLVDQNNKLIEQNNQLIKINYEQSAQINALLDQLTNDEDQSPKMYKSLDDM